MACGTPAPTHTASGSMFRTTGEHLVIFDYQGLSTSLTLNVKAVKHIDNKSGSRGSRFAYAIPFLNEPVR